VYDVLTLRFSCMLPCLADPGAQVCHAPGASARGRSTPTSAPARCVGCAREVRVCNVATAAIVLHGAAIVARQWECNGKVVAAWQYVVATDATVDLL
jgi:hypothetical protein